MARKHGKGSTKAEKRKGGERKNKMNWLNLVSRRTTRGGKSEGWGRTSTRGDQ